MCRRANWNCWSVTPNWQHGAKRWKAPKPRKDDMRGYRKLFMEQITQADEGCDFAFLKTEITTQALRKR